MPRRVRLAILTGLLVLITAFVGAALLRPRHPIVITPADLAGRYTPLYVGLHNPRRASQYHGVEVAETLTIEANGAWHTSTLDATYTFRADSLIVRAPDGEHPYRITWGGGQMGLWSATQYDFDANGLPETAVRQVVYRRLP